MVCSKLIQKSSNFFPSRCSKLHTWSKRLSFSMFMCSGSALMLRAHHASTVVCWFTQLNLSFWTTPSQNGIAQISVPQSLVSNNRAGISAWLHGLFFLPQHDPRWGPSPEIIAMQRTYTFLHVSPGWTSLKLQKDKELGFELIIVNCGFFLEVVVTFYNNKVV